MSQSMMTIPARILNAPKVRYGNQEQQPMMASWNLIKARFAVPAKIPSWSYIMISHGSPPDGYNPRTCEEFLNEFKGICGKQGMTMPPLYRFPQAVQNLQQIEIARGGNYVDQLYSKLRPAFQHLAQQKIRFVYVFLSSQDKQVYAAVKRGGDVMIGMHTICSVWSKVSKEKGRMQYFANVSLKWNLKAGGVNHLVGPALHKRIADERIMLVRTLF
jgi:eukaryotic translation initiation factor 2C